MPAPTNISAATATILMTWGTYTFDVSGAAAPTYEVWFQYTAAEGETMLGFWAHAPLPGTTYYPLTSVFTGPAGAPTAYHAFANIGGQPLQVPTTPGETYYFRIRATAGDTADQPLTISLERQPGELFPPGSLVITDDTPGFPAAVLDATTGDVLGYVDLPAGEGGEVLPDGTVLAEDKGTNTVRLYDSTLHELLNIAVGIDGDSQISSNRSNRFYVLNRGFSPADAIVTSVSNAGAILDTWTLPRGGFFGVVGQAPSHDDTVLYFVRIAGPVARWDLVNDVALSDLTASLPGGSSYNKDLLVLNDGTVLVTVNTGVSGASHLVKRFDGTAGTLLDTYTLPAGYVAEHLAHAQDDDASFWVWIQDETAGLSRIQRIAVSGGTVLEDVAQHLFEEGIRQGTDTSNPERFGVSHSCPLMVLVSAVENPSPVPNPIPPDGTNPCCAEPNPNPPPPSGTPPPGNPGDAPPPNPYEPLPPWIATCDGGGVVPQEPDETDPESYSTFSERKPSVGVSARLRIQRDTGLEEPRFSRRPYAGTVHTEGRVRVSGWAPIRRELSDDAGQLRMASAGVTLNDDDGVLRAALAEDETRFIGSTEADLTILSEQGRAADLEERLLMRARLEDAAIEIARNGTARARSVRADLVDALAAVLDETIPQRLFLRADYPNIHRELENTPIPLIGGEHSDQGAEDVAGNNAEHGMVPAIYVGGRRTVDDDPTSGTPSFLAPPEVIAVVNGTPGSRNLYYGVTKLSAVGQTTLSEIVTVATAPALLTGTDSISLAWADDPAATGYVVYGRRNSEPIRRLAELPAGSTGYTDDGTATEYAPGPPDINTAQIEGPDGSFFWDFYVICLGWVTILKLFGSNVAPGVEPARVDITATMGVDWIPFHGVIGGNEITGFFARGPRSQAAIDGTVTFAVDTCGYEDVGDGSGHSIQQAFPLLQHILTQFVPLDGGETYASGLWLPLHRWGNGSPGTPILKTSAFTACQNLTKGWLDNDEGYRGAIYIREPITVRELLQLFFQSFDAFGATNHHGQFYPVLYDAGVDLTTTQPYRSRIEVVRLENPELDKDNLEPSIAFQYDFNPDTQKYRSEIVVVKDDDAVAAQRRTLKRPQPADVKLLRWTRDPDTAYDAMERRNQRLKFPRWRQTVVTKYQPGLENEPGDVIRIDHPDGASAVGWVDRPFLLTGHVVDPNRGEVSLTGYDIRPLIVGAFAADGLEDEDTMAGNLGDETSSEPQPVGAAELQ